MNQTTFRWSLLLVVALTVVALTTLPASAALVGWTTSLLTITNHPNLRDAIGHMALYGSLTGVLYWALRRRFSFRSSFMIAVAAALLLGLATELGQRFAPGRSVQLSDLLGNWLGVMTVATLIGFRQSTKRDRSG